MTDRQIINADDTLIIRSKLVCGNVRTWELQQKPRTFKDVQAIIDGLVDTTESVTDVWRVEKDAAGIPRLEDISGMFDLRTSEEILESIAHAEAAAERRYAGRQSYQRVAGAVL